MPSDAKMKKTKKEKKRKMKQKRKKMMSLKRKMERSKKKSFLNILYQFEIHGPPVFFKSLFFPLYNKGSSSDQKILLLNILLPNGITKLSKQLMYPSVTFKRNRDDDVRHNHSIDLLSPSNYLRTVAKRASLQAI